MPPPHAWLRQKIIMREYERLNYTKLAKPVGSICIFAPSNSSFPFTMITMQKFSVPRSRWPRAVAECQWKKNGFQRFFALSRRMSQELDGACGLLVIVPGHSRAIVNDLWWMDNRIPMEFLERLPAYAGICQCHPFVFG